jgi:hypothetical protein
MRRLVGVALCVLAGLACPLAAGAAQPAKSPVVREQPVGTAAELAAWVRASGDNRGLAFVIVDKAAAKVFVFGKDGALKGSAPALLGFAVGDDSTPGIGDREMSDIPPEERTTPAGRYVAAYGHGAEDRNVFWVDYQTAISLHPVVTAKPAERRLQRLRSPTAADNRITFGCINVPAAFYDQVVRKTFSGTKGVVYILPEAMPLEAVFPSFALALTTTGGQLGGSGVQSGLAAR